jgi:hypothetical protein
MANQKGLARQISRYHITEALATVFPAAVARIFKNNEDQPQMLVVDIARMKQTKYWQLGVIFDNEGTIAGTYAVHDSIFLKHFKTKTDVTGQRAADRGGHAQGATLACSRRSTDDTTRTVGQD